MALRSFPSEVGNTTKVAQQPILMIFERKLQLEEFQDAALTANKDVKPLVFISVDGGPDEAPKNQQALAVWARQFENNDLDAVFVFTHAPGSSAYNPVEKRMAPLSKDTAGIILPFGNHLDASNKTIDLNLEIKFFEAAGNILAEIWSKSIIDNHPVVASYTSPPENEHDEVVFHKSEEWKAKHVRRSQYMLQIIKSSDVAKHGEQTTQSFFHGDFYLLLCQLQQQKMARKLT